ncbi:MAG: redox-sensing transcriptional repressor Rex [Catenulispora sp.]
MASTSSNASGGTGPDSRSGNGASLRPARQGIPEATVARLPVYLRALISMQERGIVTVSSEELAASAGVNSAKLRKDFSYLGSYGTRGVGYEVSFLVYQISRELGLTQDWAVAIVGIGNLGHALANYGGFASRGFRVAALFDADPALTGSAVAGVRVRHTDELEAANRALRISIFVIATPAPAAQAVADRLVAAGITSILNFAPVVLNVPEGVDVRKVDLSIELQILAFHEQRKGGHALPQAGAVNSEVGSGAGPRAAARPDRGSRAAGTGPAASTAAHTSAHTAGRSLDASLIDTGIPS